MTLSVRNLPWQCHDGGRKAAGYKGTTRDCVVRAIAIVTGEPYKSVYKELHALAKANPMWGQRRDPKKCSPRYGVYEKHSSAFLASRGWKWVPVDDLVPNAGDDDTFPDLGKYAIINIPQHFMAIVDGVVLDQWSPSGWRRPQVLGAWVKE